MPELYRFPAVASDLSQLDDAVKVFIVLGVEAILADPLVGRELRYVRGIGDLSDCRKLYVDVPPAERGPGPPRYRIVYRLRPTSDDPQVVEIVCVGPRADEAAYRRAVARLGRPPY